MGKLLRNRDLQSARKALNNFAHAKSPPLIKRRRREA
jgi:hypothetical protein